MNITRRPYVYVVSLVVGGIIASLLAQSPRDTDDFLKLFLLFTVGLFLCGLIISYFGLRRTPGSRFWLKWGYAQRTSHNYRRMSGDEGRAVWQRLGLPLDTFVDGSQCVSHCPLQLLVGANSGERFFVMNQATTQPWVQWIFGYIVVLAKDEPLNFVPIDERPADG